MPSPLTRLRDHEFYSPPSDPKPPPLGDRFIPTRAIMDLDHARDSLFHPRRQVDPAAATTSPSACREQHRRWVEENLPAGPDWKPFRMLAIRSPRGGGCRRSLRLVDGMLEEAKGFDSPAPAARCIPKSPIKILNAPEMAHDFYLNFMDWERKISWQWRSVMVYI